MLNADLVYSTDDPNKDMPQHLRQLMQERDLKRKRQKYRAKNVHITQKSHTEVRAMLIKRKHVKRFSVGGTCFNGIVSIFV